jgi:hypothetical protein
MQRSKTFRSYSAVYSFRFPKRVPLPLPSFSVDDRCESREKEKIRVAISRARQAVSVLRPIDDPVDNPVGLTIPSDLRSYVGSTVLRRIDDRVGSIDPVRSTIPSDLRSRQINRSCRIYDPPSLRPRNRNSNAAAFRSSSTVFVDGFGIWIPKAYYVRT